MQSWAPIVGRDFSDVGSQIYNWQNRNDSVNDANIRRAMARDQNFNNYWQQVAAMEEQQRQNDLKIATLNQNLGRQKMLDDREQYQWTADQNERRRQFDVGTKLRHEDVQARLKSEKDYRSERATERSGDRAYESAARLLDDDPFTDLPKQIINRLDPASLADIQAMQPLLQKRAVEEYQAVNASIEPANAALRQERMKRALLGVKDEEKIAQISADPKAWPAATQEDADRVLTDVRRKLGRLADRMEFRDGKFIPTMREPGKRSVVTTSVAPGQLPTVTMPAAPAPAPTFTASGPDPSYWGGGAPAGGSGWQTVPQSSGPITQEKLLNNMFNQQPAPPPMPRFQNKDQVVNDYKSGKISREQAAKILNEQFGVPYTK